MQVNLRRRAPSCRREELEAIGTERPNATTNGLASLSTVEVLRTINREDARVAGAVRKQIPAIARAVDIIVRQLKHDGRLFYVGAGTSGRLGIIDAAELLPTFGVGPELVVAIIAGGRRAVFRPVEGIEDKQEEGEKELRRNEFNGKDVLLGISASGRTPFVVGALRYANRMRSPTIVLTANEESPLTRIASIVICPNTGPEVVMGSTRMKAGTAQKLVLNMISTTAMAKLGKVHSNLMVSLRPLSKKLLERSKRIVALQTGLDYKSSGRVLREASMNVKAAILMAKTGCGLEESLELLQAARDSLEQALRLSQEKKRA